MEEWAHRQNIEHFEKDLRVVTDPERRRLLLDLLRREQASLKRLRDLRMKPISEGG